MLKIITGTAKGQILKTLEGEATRPTSQRVKEALFSSIPFDIEGRRVLDLFAGSGGLGLEAMSRGAVSCTFIDSSREAMDIIKANAKATGFFDGCRYLVSDAKNYVRKAAGRDKYDLVFIDPPYSSECCCEVLEKLLKADLLADGALVAIEGGTEKIDESLLSGFEIQKNTRYGSKTFLLILLFRKGKADA